MNPITLLETDRWLVVSYSNGGAYLVRDRMIARESFIQYGDDAAAFREDFDKTDALDYPNSDAKWAPTLDRYF